MTKDIIDVCIIEDNPGDIRLIQEMLKTPDSHEPLFKIHHEDRLAKGIDYLATNHCDVILLDLNLPDSIELDTFKHLHKSIVNIPVVILSEIGNETMAIEALRVGAQDYLIKSDFNSKSLILALRFAVERNRSNIAIQERNVALQLTKDKSLFLANMSHEIRTPLYGIIGLIDLLKATTPFTTEQQDYITLLSSSANFLLCILNDLLDLSAFEAGKLVVKKEEFNLEQLLVEVIHLISPLKRSKSINLKYFIDQSIPSHLIGSPIRIKQILINLISNAIKFTEEGVIEIRIIKEEENEHRFLLNFQVMDSGIGMSQEQQFNLFTAFSHEDHISKEHYNYAGTGLGLVISKTIVKVLEGSMGVKSSPGQGSTFWFKLPFEKNQSAKATSTAISKSSKNTSTPYSILVAEDDPISQKVISQQLRNLGYDVEVVSNGQEVLKCMNKRNYNVIFLDDNMPEMDGCTTAKEIRKQEKTKNSHCLLISLTAKTTPQDRERILASGIDEMLIKPITMERLKNFLETSLKISTNIIPVSTTFQSELIGLDILQRLVNNDKKALNELVDLHLFHTQERITQIQKAYEEGAVNQILRIAHTCIGSSGSIGCLTMTDLFRAIEQCVNEKHLDNIPDLINKLEKEIQKIRDFVSRQP